MRSIYALKSLFQLKHASLDESGSKDFWQAGKSVDGIHSVESAGAIVRRFAAVLTPSPPLHHVERGNEAAPEHR